MIIAAISCQTCCWNLYPKDAAGIPNLGPYQIRQLGNEINGPCFPLHVGFDLMSLEEKYRIHLDDLHVEELAA